jgi:hypothetical protein
MAQKNPYVRREEMARKLAAYLNPESPKGFGGRTAATGKETKSDSPMFDGRNQLNAHDRADALRQIRALIDRVASGEERWVTPTRTAEHISPSERAEIFASAFNDPTGQGFSKIGQELLLPIKEILDYEGFSRRCLKTYTLAQGQINRIDKDVDVSAMVVSADGQVLETRVSDKYVFPPEFAVMAFPSIRIDEVHQKQFDVLDRAQDRAKQAIQRQEDQGFITALTLSAPNFNDTVSISAVNVQALASLMFQVERHRLLVSKLLMNRRELADVQINLSQQVDPVTERELLMTGYVARFFNADILVTAGTQVGQGGLGRFSANWEIVPPGKIFAIADPDFLGVFPIRVELFSEPAHKFVLREPRYAWMFYELIAQTIINPRGVALATK